MNGAEVRWDRTDGGVGRSYLACYIHNICRQVKLKFEGHGVGYRLVSPVSPSGREQTLAFVIWQLHTVVVQIYIKAISGIYLTSRGKVLFVVLLI